MPLRSPGFSRSPLADIVLQCRAVRPLARIIILIASIAPFCFSSDAFAQTNTPSAESFLPKAPVTEAVYVQIEPDPAFNDYGRRIRVAREKNPEWFLDYSKKYQKTWSEPLPYHENFGVTQQEYEHFSQPMNQFREVKRKDIKIRRSTQDGHPQLDFQGDDLLLTQIVLNLQDRTANTQIDVLQKGEFVDLQIASLPPGRHRGFSFKTPGAKIIATKRRETLLIGELKDRPSGIIHYSINTPGQVKMIYIQFPR